MSAPGSEWLLAIRAQPRRGERGPTRELVSADWQGEVSPGAERVEGRSVVVDFRIGRYIRIQRIDGILVLTLQKREAVIEELRDGWATVKWRR